MTINDNLLKGYEDSKLVHYNDIPSDGANVVKFDDLPKKEVSGVLKSSRYVDGKLTQFYTEKENHVGVIAATRLGKTTSYVIPTILSFAKQKMKRSMIISDPKGELYRQTSETLRKQGYRVILLNFRDYLHSECWNPLVPIFRKYQKAFDVDKTVKVVQTENGARNVFNGMVYEDQVKLDNDVKRTKTMLMEEVGNDIDKFVVMLISVEKTTDPYWEECARDVLKAFLWAMLEDSREENFVGRGECKIKKKLITENTFSMNTILQIMGNFSDEGSSHYDELGYFRSRGSNSRAYLYAKNSFIENAPVTRKCVISSFNSKISIFRDCAMRIITSCNSFEMDSIVDGPVAIFINYRDELKVHYRIISLFLQDAYSTLIEHANKQKDGALKVPFYFILDEFGNFPPLSDFENTISACASRNILFILIIQSYAQLDRVYGKDVANIIEDNLNVHVFFGSNNPATLEMISEECGKYTRISPLSALNGSGPEIETYGTETIARVPKSMLSHFEEGECIVTEANCGYVLWSKLERYYNCKEFNNLAVADINDYACKINPFDAKYNYSCIVTKSKFDF